MKKLISQLERANGARMKGKFKKIMLANADNAELISLLKERLKEWNASKDSDQLHERIARFDRGQGKGTRAYYISYIWLHCLTKFTKMITTSFSN